MDFWEQFAGRVIDGWVLGRVLHANGPIAIFAVQREGRDEPGAMKVLLLRPVQIDDQLRQWEETAKLEHPNLLRALAHGSTELEGATAAYIVTELADDDLSTAVRDRRLTEKETAEVLEPVLAAVSYLHSKVIVHGRIRPTNVLALGDSVKLSSDSLLPEGQAPVYARASDGHDAPELNKSVVPLAAGDVWSIGALICEALTQRTTPGADGKLPGAYGDGAYHDIIDHALREDPDQRWSLSEIRARLKGPVTAPPVAAATPIVPVAPVAAVPKPEAVPAFATVPTRAPFKRRDPEVEPEPKRNWKYAALGGAAALILLVVFLLARKPRPDDPVAPVPARSLPAAAAPSDVPANPRPAAPLPQRKPSPLSATTRNPANRWYVVVATYGRRQDAERRASRIAHKWPRFSVRVYEPPVDNPHHLVVIGENLSRDQAYELQRRARAAGMPRDVYIRQFAGG